jgi:hypothetical protein
VLVQLGLWQATDDRAIHQQMIGRISPRTTRFAILAFVLALGLFAGRSADPADAQPAAFARQAHAARDLLKTADAALGRLEDALAGAVEEARSGAALVLAGDAAPDERFDAAADAVEAAQGWAAQARGALGELDRRGSSLRPAVAAPEAPTGESQLLALGAQLRAAGSTAAAVAGLRHASGEVLDHLETALAAATEADSSAIERAVAAAREGMPRVERWSDALPTLPVWTSAVDGLLGALDRLAAAQRSGSEAQLAAALTGYHEAAGEAERADRGLAIALADAAAAVGAGAPAALADALADVRACRAALASLVLGRAAEGAE